MKRWVKRVLRVLLPLAVWLGAWQCLAGWVGLELLLPGPGRVLERLVALCPTPLFWRAALATLGRVFLGGALGALGGALVAALSARWEPVDWVMTPMMKVVRATPVASFILLIWLWCQAGWVPAVIAALMSAPVVWGATAQAIGDTDPQLLEMARAYRFSRWKTGRLVYLPSVLPAVLAGCRTALGLAWKAGVAAEVLCRPRRALGTQVYNAKLSMETADLFAWTAVVVCLSFAVERALWWAWRALDRRGRRWGHGDP